MFRAAVADFKRNLIKFNVAAPVNRRPVSRSLSMACALAVAGLTAVTGPIGIAISRYGNATGRDVLYDANLASGRVSSEVRGVFTQDEALSKLLVGTGLKAEFVTGKTFALLPAPVSPQARQSLSPEHRRYYGLIQAGITDALCESQGAHPGRYRFIAKLWITPDGAVARSRRIGSTGAPRRDHEIDAALHRVQLNTAPPPDFRQPVIILVVPQAEGVTRGCDRP
jgi:hypothetical protein